ncbi:hypothetical protein [Microbaculum marinisediminis]|uniref:Uncharacterized protein n=1 Tax=Microbaculum marinisediminis TaxID=2931392 RepID=A0AAW5QTN0_9HYPH|nr:hypothetical protein [Microbaculum sp. A6E488]MCT8970567.1 hypothetical protein [Microbaculum sp. A6E488]
MIGMLLERAGGPWGMLAKVAISILIVAALAGGIVWLRADAAADAKAQCEAAFTDMVSRVAFDELLRRHEATEAALRASALLRERDDAEIADLTREVDRYERERKDKRDQGRCVYRLDDDYCGLLELRGEDRPECRGGDR